MEPKKKEADQFATATVETGKKPFNLTGFCFLIAVLIAILYFNSLGNQFTNWDDGMIYQNPSIRDLSWQGIKKIFRLEHGNTYQPIRMLSYAIDYKIWKFNPVGYHITNIFFYILTCIMVYFTLHHLSMHLREKAPPDSHGGLPFLEPSFCCPSCSCRGCHLACRKKRGPSRVFLFPCILSLPQSKRGGQTENLLLKPRDPLSCFCNSLKALCSGFPRRDHCL